MAKSKLLLKKEKKRYSIKIKKHKSKGNRDTPTETVEDEYERLGDYVSLKFKKDIPFTDDDILDYIKKELKHDPSFNFLRNVNDSSYKNFIEYIKANPQYQKALDDAKTDIKINKTKKIRRGIIVPKAPKIFFIPVRFKNKKTNKIVQYKRYYSVNDGKAVTKNKAEKFISIKSKGEMKTIDSIEKIRKKQTPLGRIKSKREQKSRLKKLRGR